MSCAQQLSCSICSVQLHEPYVRCAECRHLTYICLYCFSKGMETANHESDHNYNVIRSDFPLFDPCWTAQEETQLLQALADCGYGNWADVANQVTTKSKKQCEQHYNRYYIERPHTELPVFPEANLTLYPSPIVFTVSDDPLRPPEGTTYQNELAGYSAARGDFSVEPDNYAEQELNDIDLSDSEADPLHEALQFAVVDVYQNKLRERQRKKKIIRQLGLINIKRTQAWLWRYEQVLRDMCCVDDIRPILKLLKPHNITKLLESINHIHQLRGEIKRLQDYRSNGIKRLAMSEVYECLKSRRTNNIGQRSALETLLASIQDDNSCNMWLQKQAELGISNPQSAQALRKTAPPLDISSMPAYDKLQTNEKDLCALVRLVPAAYLEFRRILENENTKNGSLRLAQARNLIKIDVNKTRKIYDFLINEHIINKDPQ